jgi:hypothetical protein
MLVSPIFEVLAIDRHDCLFRILELTPESKLQVDLAFGLEFGFKGDSIRVSGRAKKDKSTVLGEQLISFV